MKLWFKKYFIFIAITLILFSLIINYNNSLTRSIKLYQLRGEINNFENRRIQFSLSTLYLNQNYIKYSLTAQSHEEDSEEIDKSINKNIIGSINSFSALMPNNKKYNEEMINSIISSGLYEIQKKNRLLGLLELNIDDYNIEFERLASRWVKNKENLKKLEEKYGVYNFLFIILQSIAIVVLSYGTTLKEKNNNSSS